MMTILDSSPKGIFEMSWSPDGKWISYVTGEDEVRVANAENGEIRIIGTGSSPNITQKQTVVFERNSEIIHAISGGEKILISRKDIVKDTPKTNPTVSPDGELLVVSVSNVLDKESQSKNAYQHRHFLAISPIEGGKAKLTREQFYGGTCSWFPDAKRFVHFEFDSTGGPQIHIIKRDGTREATVAGLYPSISPDGCRIAARPKSGGSLVIYSSKDNWEPASIDTTVLRIPGETTRAGATPAVWIDNRFAIVHEGSRIFRIDTKRDKADEMKKFPTPTERRKATMIPSPSRELLALEIEVDDTFTLRLIPLA